MRSIEGIYTLTRKAERMVTYRAQVAVIFGNTTVVYGLKDIYLSSYKKT